VDLWNTKLLLLLLLLLLTLRQLYISRVDGRSTYIIFEVTDEDQNLIHGKNSNNPVLHHRVNSCHAENWMSKMGFWTNKF